MKITSAQLQLTASHVSQQSYESSESLNVWVGQQRRSAQQATAPSSQPADIVTLSDAAIQGNTASASNDAVNAMTDSDPKLSLIRLMLEFLTGKKFRIFDSSQLQTSTTTSPTASTGSQNASPAPTPAGYGIAYDHHESHSETEQTSFSASGTVTTADGRNIDFSLGLSMSRSYHEESDVSVRLGDAARQTDPLVLNFAGNAAQLTDQRFAFDLNSDGSKEQINFVKPGSGFLVFDRNHDGVINNGSELFGPASGNGFSELSALDSDKNGWIDENDPAFSQLQVWSRDNAGNNQLQSLAAAGVGAIALDHASTPFDLKTNANQLLGQIRSTGIFLQESGSTGTIQQIDLTA